MKKAARVGEQNGLPLYIHFGQLWPEATPAAAMLNPDSISQRYWIFAQAR